MEVVVRIPDLHMDSRSQETACTCTKSWWQFASFGTPEGNQRASAVNVWAHQPGYRNICRPLPIIMKLAAKAALSLIQIFGCPSKRKLTIWITHTHPCNIGFFEIVLISCTPSKIIWRTGVANYASHIGTTGDRKAICSLKTQTLGTVCSFPQDSRSGATSRVL
jgi:hypothetical protein